MLGPEGLTEKQTAFSDPEAVMAWAQAHRGGATADRVRRLAARLIRTDGVQPVGEAPSPGRPARYSTTELVEIEIATLALVEQGREAGAPSIEPERLEAIERADGIVLSAEQEAMVREVATSPSRVICVVGLAGAGKTTATHAVGQVFRQAGIPVIGAAPSGVAAEKLQDETGIQSTTLHRLLDEARNGDGLPRGSVLVVDEAAMAETRVLAPVLDLVEQAGGKAILIGDPHQLPAVGAGGLFAGIVEREGAVVLTENRRQQDELEREVLARVRAGVGRDYLAYAEKRERLVVSESPVTTRARLLADWWQQARDDLTGNVMLALRRADVADLNQLGRALMDTDGRLGTDRLVIADREFAAGDRVVCLRNSDVLGVKNGTLGTVRHVDLERRTLDHRHRPRPDASNSAAATSRQATLATPTRSQATPPRASPSSVHSSSAPAKHAYRNGATSPSPEHAPKPVSTSPAPRASTKATSTTSTTAIRSPASAARSKSRQLKSSRSTRSRCLQGRATTHDPRSSAPTSARKSSSRRLLEQKKLALTKTQNSAQRRLEDAEQRLERSGTFRRRGRAQLRAEIELQQHAIALAKRQLAETIESIEQLPTTTRLRPRRDVVQEERTLLRERGTMSLRLER